MGLNFDVLVYLPNYDVFAVDCTFVPYASQPTAGAFDGRGIFDTRTVDVPADDGSVFSDQRTILDIRESEFGTLPQQLDHVIIPYDCNGAPLGEYEIVNSWTNGGGETTLVLRKVEIKDGT